VSAPKQPQDHKVKASKGFAFTGKDGKRHMFPPPQVGMDKLDTGTMAEALLGGEEKSAAFPFKLLLAAGPSKEALAAFYALPMSRGQEVLAEWVDQVDEDGSTVPEG
jgi:hypothetical protein